MLEGKMIMDKLYMLADEFKVHMKNKKYYQAKSCYDTAVKVAVFLELEEGTKQELFGERGERGVILKKGMFPEEQVVKAYGECVKRNQTREHQKYTPLRKKDSA